MSYSLDQRLHEHKLTFSDLKQEPKAYGLYPNAFQEMQGAQFFMSQSPQEFLYVMGSGPLFEAFQGDLLTGSVKKCSLTKENAAKMREHFPFTAPTADKSRGISIGLGDRLGNATPGHIQSVRGHHLLPIFAQQSIRELKFTGRDYQQVLDAATWSVFQEGYEEGFGADGDHLKTEEEVTMALNYGFTMITLDCSDHINNDIAGMTQAQIDQAYLDLPQSVRTYYEDQYLNKEVVLKSGHAFTYTRDELRQLVMVYHQAIQFTVTLYDKLIAPRADSVIFEMSIDETQTPTSPSAHYFVASELITKGAAIDHLAPRFCGEFQKGIDYIGSVSQFEEEMNIHFAIAEELGYKISVHSGSDKFTLFPIIGRVTKGKFHLKTAGTSWLEAIRLIADKSPDLYREIHEFAVENLPEAMKHYTINGRPEHVPDLDSLPDDDLPGLMDQNDARQIIHISYGYILQAKNEDGSDRFKSRMYRVWQAHENDYGNGLAKHIDKHLEALGL